VIGEVREDFASFPSSIEFECSRITDFCLYVDLRGDTYDGDSDRTVTTEGQSGDGDRTATGQVQDSDGNRTSKES
jgi:hypothetical protein